MKSLFRTALRVASVVSLLPAASLAAGSPSPDALRAQCLLHGADPKNPWALAHGITGLGRDFAAADGRPAAEVIVSDYLEASPQVGAGSYGFRKYAEDGTPIEPHPNLLVKTLVLAGIKDGRRFKTGFGEVTLAQLVESAKQGFRHVPQNEAYWQDVAWTLDLLAERLTPKAATFQNGAGETVDFNQVMEDALGYLELAQKALEEGMAKGAPQVPKRKQGIYAHSCGGLHLFQAVAHWARHPQVRKRWGKRLEQQFKILFYRLHSEQQQYEAALAQAPQYRLQLLTQLLKFHGHFLETTGRLRKDTGFRPDKAQQRDLERSRALLDWTTKELQGMGVFDQMDAVRKSHPQIHLDLIGDSCHAVNGLALWQAYRR